MLSFGKGTYCQVGSEYMTLEYSCSHACRKLDNQIKKK